MQHDLMGKIAAAAGLVAVLYGLICSIGSIQSLLFGITAGGALNGAITFFLMAIMFFLWPSGGGGGTVTPPE